MSRGKRDKYDRMFFGFRDQLTPRYGYEDAKKLAYAFIKLLRKNKGHYIDLYWDVYNLRCCDIGDTLDVEKYNRLRTPPANGKSEIDEIVAVNGKQYKI